MRAYLVGGVTLISAVILFPVGAGFAQTASLASAVVEAFLGNCVLNLPNLEKVRAASRVFGWKALSRDETMVMGPLDRSADAEVWMAADKNVRYLIGISRGTLGSQPIASCTVAHPELQQKAVLGSLQDKLKLKYLNDEREGGQRYQSWTAEVNGYSQLITLTTMQADGSSGGSLAAAVKLR
jgi:hypothetical protein